MPSVEELLSVAEVIADTRNTSIVYVYACC